MVLSPSKLSPSKLNPRKMVTNSLRCIRLVALLAAMALAALGCADTGSGGGGGGGGTTADTTTSGADTTTGGGDTVSGGDTASGSDAVSDTGGGGTEVTVADIKQAPMAAKCSAPAFQNFKEGVTIRNLVVVTKVEQQTSFDGIYVQAKGGGKWSGLYVKRSSKAADGGADAAFRALQPGDVITVTGGALTYYCFTEFDAKLWSKEDAVEAPVASTLTTADVGEKASVDANEEWEGALVTLNDVVVSQIDVKGDDGKTHGEIMIGTSDSDESIIVKPSLAWATPFSSYDKDSKTWTVLVAKGKKYSSVTGVLTYDFSKYRLVPLGAAAMID